MTGLEHFLPTDVSQHGTAVNAAVTTSVAILGALAAIASIWLIYLVVRGRRRSSESVSVSVSVIGPIAVATLFVVGIDGFLWWQSTGLTHSADPHALRIEVNAHQWAWEFRYAGRDNLFATADDVVTTNELRVPAGQAVELSLASSDVVHSFHLPNLRVKRDAIPGRLSQVAFTATAPGRFVIACAQFCGVMHYRMQGTLLVVEPAALQRWLEQGSQDSVRIAAEKDRAAHDGEVRNDSLFPDLAPHADSRDWGWPWP